MNRLHATKDFWLAALRADGPALQDAVEEAGPDTAVPSCPGWTVAVLTAHLTAQLRWVREIVPRGTTERPDPPAVPESLPEWAEALDGLRRELTGTIETLDAVDAEHPAWNWAPQPKSAAFWQRRMAHEISIHRWDVQQAVGRAVPVETKLAADGVFEVLDTFLPAGRRKGPTDVHGVAHLVATDAGYDWFVRLRGAGIALLDTGTILDSDDHHQQAEVAGTAGELLLTLWGRRPVDAILASGDPRLLSALQTG
jgi:uncharacterized protein (TIGR03083 family)